MLSIDSKLFTELRRISEVAGEKIMDIYNSDDFEVKQKSNMSPVTEADIAAQSVIQDELEELYPEIPFVGEENSEDANHEAAENEEYWIVDPLDGTKEFIKKGKEFTVNIGLIRHGVPVAGIVFLPYSKDAYYGGLDFGAFKSTPSGELLQLFADKGTEVKSAVASKSHFDEKTEKFLGQFGEIEFVQAGSSLKLCLVAEGKAQIYPRFAPTMEWDTGAAHAVVIAAGGKVIGLDGNPLAYNKPELRNPGFICVGPNINFEN